MIMKLLSLLTLFISLNVFSQVVVLETSAGNIEISLNERAAPITVKNFLSYVDDGFYNGTIFHRVINGFMIQGGGFDEKMFEQKTKAPIKNEAGNGLTNDKMTIAMARTGIVDSATAQFFINVENNNALNHRDETPSGFGYAVFGNVIKGTDVVNKIKMAKTGTRGPHGDVPVENIVIKKAYRKDFTPTPTAAATQTAAPTKKKTAVKK